MRKIVCVCFFFFDAHIVRARNSPAPAAYPVYGGWHTVLIGVGRGKYPDFDLLSTTTVGKFAVVSSKINQHTLLVIIIVDKELFVSLFLASRTNGFNNKFAIDINIRLRAK